MARRLRVVPTGYVYHVGNRGSRRGPLFHDASEFDAFEQQIAVARNMFEVRLIAYCLMSNHLHFLLWPLDDHAISRFMQWLTGTHAQQFRWRTNSIGEGAVYQSRFWAQPTFDALHLLAAWRYIERNPVEAGLVAHAQDWQWSSASTLERSQERLTLDLGPIARPPDWLDLVNASYVDRFIDYVSC
jgi:putative transposase